MNSLLVKTIDKIFPPQTVYAHCDIPCGIYDPHAAQIAAHTVIRMTTMLNDHKDDAHAIARLSAVKEEHAEIVKHEITILWADYFKPEHIKETPDLHNLVFNTLKLASKTKQGVDEKVAYELLESVQKIATIFWMTKGMETQKVAAPYPTEKELVVPKLK